MEKIFVDNSRAKQVLNFNFSTNMLFKCTTMEYAEDLLSGNIFLNIPEKWIEMEEKSNNKGQGDSLEGICLITDKNDDSEFISNLKANNDFEYFQKEDKIFFRRKKVKKLYCYCIYGLNDNSFIEKYENRFGHINYCSRINKDYFTKFSEVKSKEEYFNIQKPKRPAVVFISNPHLFFERVRNKLIQLGFNREDIIISPVEYVNKNENSVALLSYPKELLLKDIFFKNQSEIRIILNSDNEELLKKIEDNNQKINIGKIDDIAEIYDYYFEDMILMKEGNSILFNLPFSQVVPFEKQTLRELFSIFAQTIKDELPDPTPIQERKKIINNIKRIIKDRYGFDIKWENGSIVTYGFYGNLNEIIDK